MSCIALPFSSCTGSMFQMPLTADVQTPLVYRAAPSFSSCRSHCIQPQRHTPRCLGSCTRFQAEKHRRDATGPSPSPASAAASCHWRSRRGAAKRLPGGPGKPGPCACPQSTPGQRSDEAACILPAGSCAATRAEVKALGLGPWRNCCRRTFINAVPSATRPLRQSG